MARRRCGAQALALSRAVGNRPGEAASLDSLGYAYHLRLGSHREAAVCLSGAQDLFLALGDRYNRAVTLVHLGDAQRGNGRAADAQQTWRQALAILEDIRHPEAAEVRERLGGGHPADATNDAGRQPAVAAAE
jgi:hypothetical protein